MFCSLSVDFMMLFFFFFFQAEDGIRDYKVTGVQTCALPICILSRSVEEKKVAVLIPAMGAGVGGMTPGERRLAERLEQKLEDDYMLLDDVPIGPKQTHPDFVGIHPRRGVLILETKDWRVEEG